MKGIPTLSDQVLKPWPMSQWVAGLGEMLREAKVLPHAMKTKVPMEMRQTHLGVWVIFSLARNLKAGMRIPFDPAGFRSLRLIQRSPKEMEITARGGYGKYRVRLTILESPATLLRCTTTLTPCAEFKIEAMPRDMCFLDGKLNAFPGAAAYLPDGQHRAADVSPDSRPAGRYGLLFPKRHRALRLRQKNRCGPRRMRGRALARCRLRRARWHAKGADGWSANVPGGISSMSTYGCGVLRPPYPVISR